MDINLDRLVNFKPWNALQYRHLVASTYQLQASCLHVHDGEDGRASGPCHGSCVAVGQERDWTYFVTAEHCVAEYTKRNSHGQNFRMSCDRMHADRKCIGVDILKGGQILHDSTQSHEVLKTFPDRGITVFRMKLDVKSSPTLELFPWPKNEPVPYICVAGYRARPRHDRAEVDITGRVRIASTQLEGIYGQYECCLSAMSEALFVELDLEDELSDSAKAVAQLKAPWKYQRNPLETAESKTILYYPSSVAAFSGGPVSIAPGTFSAVTVSGCESIGTYASLILEDDPIFEFIK